MATKKKVNNADVITTRVPLTVKKKLEKLAEQKDRSVAYIVKHILIQAVA